MSTSDSSAYIDWTREDLIKRIARLESQLGSTGIPSVETSSFNGQVQKKPFDFNSYKKRKIALKFCYSGWEYNGLAYQHVPTPLPTVEGVLFDAFVKAKLVDPDAGFDGCGWEKCGRTDRGVSAAGQVISLWVRSALQEHEAEPQVEPSTSFPPALSSEEPSEADWSSPADDEFGPLGISPPSSPTGYNQAKSLEKYKPEHNYVSILNRLLPPTIRILAWSPVSPNFSARFSCQYRHYKYFFSPRGLDIDRMQAAASRLIGEHDFRNLCKLDPAKQITSFRRKILSVSLEPVDLSHPDIFVFNLIGSAFLYHQVRHIMAILFLVGSGLEHPSVVTCLMNVTEGAENSFYETDPALRVIDGRPEYQMADALPLMLWDCGYKPEDITWQVRGHMDEQKRKESAENGNGELYQALDSIYSRSTITSALNQHFLAAAAQYHSPPFGAFPLAQPPSVTETLKRPMYIPLGGGTFKRAMKYTPLLDRVRMSPAEVVNERWRNGKGMRREERRRVEAVQDDDE